MKKGLNFFSKKLKQYYNRLLEIKDHPEKIAMGFALGSFIGMTPLVGLQFVISVALASILKWNKIAAGIAVFNTNIVTGIFIFSFNYKLGTKILGMEPSFIFPEKLNIGFLKILLNAGYEVIFSLVVGGIATGIPTAIVGYFFIKFLLKKRKNGKRI
ncbi:MAG: DUF2062 domain-containing protein [Bacteroidota bacterium]